MLSDPTAVLDTTNLAISGLRDARAVAGRAANRFLQHALSTNILPLLGNFGRTGAVSELYWAQ